MTDYLHYTCDFSSPDLPAAFDEVSLWSAQFGKLLLNHLELRPNLKILDVGCGTGFPSLELEDWRKIVDPIDEKAVFAFIETKLNTLARKNRELRMTIPMLLLEAQKP